MRVVERDGWFVRCGTHYYSGKSHSTPGHETWTYHIFEAHLFPSKESAKDWVENSDKQEADKVVGKVALCAAMADEIEMS